MEMEDSRREKILMPYISPQVGYYIGDKLHPDDVVVPNRPASYYEWNGSVWAINTNLQTTYNRYLSEESEQADGKSDAAIMALLDQTKAQWVLWVTSNLTIITLPAERAKVAALFLLAAMYASKIIR